MKSNSPQSRESSKERTSHSVHPVTVHRQSLQSGLYELIPLPFVDDWLIARERRSLVEKVLERRGIAFESRVPKLLADGGAKTLMGRFRGLLKGLVLKPLKKVLRTFFFWLTIRRAVLTMLETYFLARFANFPELAEGQPITTDEAKKWGKLFAEVVNNIDRKIAKQSTKQLWEWMRTRKQQSRDEVTPEEVEAEIEKEVPGILANFDRQMREGLSRLS